MIFVQRAYIMKKKACIIILILSANGLLNGVSHIAQGIAVRGISGVNYGGVVFPLMIGIGAVCFLIKNKQSSQNGNKD